MKARVAVARLRFGVPILAVAVTTYVSGCSTPVNLQQRVAPYPGYGQSPMQMKHDSAQCESWAQSHANLSGDDAANGTLGGAALGSALGAGMGAIAGSFLESPREGAEIGASVGAARGAVEGAAGSAIAQDARLLAAYRNCMAARGYVVGGVTVTPTSEPSQRVESPAGTGSDDRRLRMLRQLRDDGLITEGEYADKRAAILHPANSRTADRLHLLQQLRDEGLLTEREYQQTRSRIIHDL